MNYMMHGSHLRDGGNLKVLTVPKLLHAASDFKLFIHDSPTQLPFP